MQLKHYYCGKLSFYKPWTSSPGSGAWGSSALVSGTAPGTVQHWGQFRTTCTLGITGNIWGSLQVDTHTGFSWIAKITQNQQLNQRLHLTPTPLVPQLHPAFILWILVCPTKSLSKNHDLSCLLHSINQNLVPVSWSFGNGRLNAGFVLWSWHLDMLWKSLQIYEIEMLMPWHMSTWSDFQNPQDGSSNDPNEPPL